MVVVVWAGEMTGNRGWFCLLMINLCADLVQMKIANAKVGDLVELLQEPLLVG